MTAARQPVPDSVEPLWDAQQVAAHLGIHIRTVRTYQRQIGAIKVGRAVRFRREDVEAFEARGRMPVPSSTPTEITSARQWRRPALKHKTERNPLTGLRWGEYR